MTKTIEVDRDDVRPGDTVSLTKNGRTVTGPAAECPGNIHIRWRDDRIAGACTDDGWSFFTALREVPEWKPGTVGTATVLYGGDLHRAHTRKVFYTAGVVAPGETTRPWVDELGNLLADDEVTALVPDDAEALGRELHHLRAKVEGYEFGEATTIKLLRAEVERLSGDWRSLPEEVLERWASLSRAEAIRQAEQLSSSLKAQFAANEDLRQQIISARETVRTMAHMLGVTELDSQTIHDAIKALQAEVERLRAAALPTDLTVCACSWESEDRGGGHSEVVAEYEPACPVHSTHVYDPRQGMWVERAARTLPTRERVAEAIQGARTRLKDYLEQFAVLPEHGVLASPSVYCVQPMDAATDVLALFEQGGAAPKVTREYLEDQIADALYVLDTEDFTKRRTESWRDLCDRLAEQATTGAFHGLRNLGIEVSE